MTVKQIQHLLAYLNYPVEPDGIYGPQTKAAALAFQKAYGGIAQDGDPRGPETQNALLDAVFQGKARYDAQEDTEAEKDQPYDYWDEIQFFTRGEFACTCNGRYCSGFPVEPDAKLVQTLDAIRRHFGKPISPNSAIRCPQRNAQVGGAANSQHMYGRACDFSIAGEKPGDIAAYAQSLLPDTGGIGIYPWGVHIDTRADKARWNG